MKFKIREYDNCWNWKVSKNKALEVQLTLEKGFADWFKFCLETKSKQDHPGIYLTFELLTIFYFHVWFYDGRHWDYDNDCFKIYENDTDKI